MIKIVEYSIDEVSPGVWNCYTFDPFLNMYDFEDFTGLGSSPTEAYADWTFSNDILVNDQGQHHYTIQLD